MDSGAKPILENRFTQFNLILLDNVTGELMLNPRDESEQPITTNIRTLSTPIVTTPSMTTVTTSFATIVTTPSPTTTLSTANMTPQPAQRVQIVPAIPPPPRAIVEDTFSTDYLGKGKLLDFSNTIPRYL